MITNCDVFQRGANQLHAYDIQRNTSNISKNRSVLFVSNCYTIIIMQASIVAVFLLAVASVAYCSTCVKPAEVEATSFSTQDATVVSEIALVTEFSLKCSNGGAPASLYADIDGSMQTAVARIGDKYQVSWTEDIKKARSGDRNIRIFDEEGYAALRKAIRSGEDPSAVAPLVTIVINHPGAFTGPWLKSEFMAAALSVVVAYAAFSSKSKLLA